MSNSTYFFKQAEHASTAKQAAAMCFRDNSKDLADNFLLLNGLKPQDMIYPGHTLLYPSRSGVAECTAPMAHEVSQRLAHHFRHAGAPPQPQAFNRNFTLAALAPSGKDYLTSGADLTLKTVAVRNSHFLTNIAPTIEHLGSIGDKALNIHLGNLLVKGGNASATQRGMLLAAKSDLRSSVSSLNKYVKTINPPSGLGADAAAMNLDDLTRRFVLAGAKNDAGHTSALINGVNTQITRSIKTSNRLLIPLDSSADLAESISKQKQMLKQIGVWGDRAGAGLTAISAGADIYSMHQTAAAAQKRFGGAASEIVQVHQSSKIAGGVVAGYASGLVAGAAIEAAVPLLAIGPVGWAGFAAVAIVSIGATFIASKAGEAGGSYVGEKLLKASAPNISDEVDRVIDFTENPVPLP